MNTLEIIKEFNGIIGAVCGTISTLIVTQLLKKVGKLKIYPSNWNGALKTYGNVGCSMGGERDNDLYCYIFSFELDLFNTSDSFKIMRNISICFNENKKEKMKVIPDDESTRRVSACRSIADAIKIVNIAPKQIINLNLSGYIQKENLEQIMNVDAVFLKFYNEKDKVIKKLVTKLTIQRTEVN